VAQALRMWADHVTSSRLPAWRVVGLEVIDRATARRRWDNQSRVVVSELGEIRPMEGGEL